MSSHSPLDFCQFRARFPMELFRTLLLLRFIRNSPPLCVLSEWLTVFHDYDTEEALCIAISKGTLVFLRPLNGFVSIRFCCFPGPVIAHVAGYHKHYENEPHITVDHIYDIDQTVERQSHGDKETGHP